MQQNLQVNKLLELFHDQCTHCIVSNDNGETPIGVESNHIPEDNSIFNSSTRPLRHRLKDNVTSHNEGLFQL